MTPTLACGPYIPLDTVGAWVSIAVFLLFKPAAYYGFIQAFRYRVSRPIPMTFGLAAKLTLARTALGVLLFALGTAVVWAIGSGSGSVLAWSWLYLYTARAVAWYLVGARGAALRGRRLLGWVISGTLLNGAIDAAVVFGLFTEWLIPAAILLGIGLFIAALHIIGRRPTLRSRFSDDPACRRCDYNLTGNLSGRCPECGTVVAM